MNGSETTIVIRTFNEEKHLPALLDSIARQRYREFEVVVVDSGSWDRTREIARGFTPHIHRIEAHDFTFGYSLNQGIQRARGRFLVLVSAHTLPLDESWLESLIEPLREERVAMVYGRQLGAGVSKFSERQDLKRTFGLERQVLRPPHFFANNANAAIRRDLWDQYAFDEALTGLEDVDWAKHWMERGYEVVYEPRAALYHIHEESWPQVHRRYYREAVAARAIGLRHRADALLEVPREIGHAIADLIECLSPPESECPARGRLETIREILQFRFHKTVGAVRGLLDGEGMKDPGTRRKMLFDKPVKAVVIEGPQRASLRETELPEVRPGDVLIEVSHVGVCGTDLEILEGRLGYFQTGLASYPITPGHEFSGRIVSVGQNVQHLKESDPVVVECIQGCGACPECRRNNPIGCPQRAEMGVIRRNGAYATHVVVPGRFVHRIPDGLDLQRAVLCEPLAVVLKAVRRLTRALDPEPGSKSCAVIGQGPVGNLCAQVLAHYGHQVTVFDRDARRLGLIHHPSVKAGSDVERLEEFEAIVEVTGDPDALHAMLKNSGAGATILLLGLPYAHRHFTFESIVAYDKTVVGSVGSSSAEFKEALQMLPALELAPFLQCQLGLDEFDTAWKMFHARDHLKILLHPGAG